MESGQPESVRAVLLAEEVEELLKAAREMRYPAVVALQLAVDLRQMLGRSPAAGWAPYRHADTLHSRNRAHAAVESGAAVGFRVFLGTSRSGLLEQAQKFFQMLGKSCNPGLVAPEKPVDFGQMLQCRGGSR